MPKVNFYSRHGVCSEEIYVETDIDLFSAGGASNEQIAAIIRLFEQNIQAFPDLEPKIEEVKEDFATLKAVSSYNAQYRKDMYPKEHKIWKKCYAKMRKHILSWGKFYLKKVRKEEFNAFNGPFEVIGMGWLRKPEMVKTFNIERRFTADGYGQVELSTYKKMACSLFFHWDYAEDKSTVWQSLGKTGRPKFKRGRLKPGKVYWFSFYVSNLKGNSKRSNMIRVEMWEGGRIGWYYCPDYYDVGDPRSKAYVIGG